MMILNYLKEFLDLVWKAFILLLVCLTTIYFVKGRTKYVPQRISDLNDDALVKRANELLRRIKTRR